MVAISFSSISHDQIMKEAVFPSNKCRYKTGKCTNARSSKRNGQPHQLCLYHRDKANKIQRKFDRQKRQVTRSNKLIGGRRDFSSSPTFAALASHEVEIYSDSDSSRFSTDSDASSTSVLDHLWSDLPQSAPMVQSTRVHATLTTQTNANNNQDLSHDEIDFLCAAVLEEI